jgi:hypothetical protein
VPSDPAVLRRLDLTSEDPLADRITANLPSRDFDVTLGFYAALGFAPVYRGKDWLILSRNGQSLEFFHHPGLNPQDSWFSACLRVDDPQGLLDCWQQLGLSEEPGHIPRLTGFFAPDDAPRMFAVIDPDGSLLRVIANEDE